MGADVPQNKTMKLMAILLLIWCILPLNSRGAQDETSGDIKSSSELSLKEILKLTLVNNLDIKVADIAPLEKEGSFTAALGEYDYNVAFKYSYDHSDTPTTSTDQGVSSNIIQNTRTYAPTLSKKTRWGTELSLPYEYKVVDSNSTAASVILGHNTSLGLNLKQPLTKSFYPWYFARNLTTLGLDLEIARLKNRTDVIDIISRTLELYFDTIKEKESVRIREMSRDQSQQTLEFSKNKHSLGKASLVDLLEAEGKFQKSQESLLEAQASYQNKADELALGVYAQPGIPINAAEDFDNLEIAPTEYNEEEVILQTIKDRFEVKSAAQSIEKATIENKAAQVDKLPNVTLDSGFSYKGLGTSFQKSQTEINRGNSPSYNVTINVEKPIMNYAAKGEAQIKLLRLQQENLRRASLERNIALEIRKNLRQLQNNWLRIQALKKVVSAEKEKYKGQSRRFKDGAISIFDLSQAQQDKDQAEFELLSAKVSYIKSRFQLSKARGKLFEELGLN